MKCTVLGIDLHKFSEKYNIFWIEEKNWVGIVKKSNNG